MIGDTFIYKGETYCITSSRRVGTGRLVTAVMISGDPRYEYSFYFPSREVLSQPNARANFTGGRQGEGEHHA